MADAIPNNILGPDADQYLQDAMDDLANARAIALPLLEADLRRQESETSTSSTGLLMLGAAGTAVALAVRQVTKKKQPTRQNRRKKR
jgi:hypothetical protein